MAGGNSVFCRSGSLPFERPNDTLPKMRPLLLLLVTLVAVDTALAQKLPPGGYQNRLPSCMRESSNPIGNRRVSMNLRDTSLGEAIELLAVTQAFKYRIERTKVIIVLASASVLDEGGCMLLLDLPAGRAHPMIQAMKKRPKDGTSSSSKTNDRIDMKPIFRSMGFKFPPGTFASYDERRELLFLLCDRPSTLNEVEIAVDQICGKKSRPQIKRAHEKIRHTAAMRRKLDSIIIPKVDFAETPMSRAVEVLMQESRRRDPDGVGVEIVLEEP